MLKKFASVVSVLLVLVFVCSAQAGASELSEEENRLFDSEEYPPLNEAGKYCGDECECGCCGGHKDPASRP